MHHPGGGGACPDISNIRRLRSFFFGLKFYISIFLGFSEKIRFCGYFCGGYHEIGLYLGIILFILGSFFTVKVPNAGHFLELLKFQIFFQSA